MSAVPSKTYFKFIQEYYVSTRHVGRFFDIYEILLKERLQRTNSDNGWKGLSSCGGYTNEKQIVDHLKDLLARVSNNILAQCGDQYTELSKKRRWLV